MACCATTTDVWFEWTTGAATTTTAATTTACWRTWNEADCTTTASSGVTRTVWARWVTAGSSASSAAVTTSQTVRVEYREPTPEEKERLAAERVRRAEESLRLEAERKGTEEAADKRAEELLVALLDDEQKAEYRRERAFHVRARDGRRYRVHRAWSGHVTRLDDAGKSVERFCIHPRVKVPLPDNQLLAKLMLETDPEGFRRAANVSPVVA